MVREGDANICRAMHGRVDWQRVAAWLLREGGGWGRHLLCFGWVLVLEVLKEDIIMVMCEVLRMG
jgi:hypothetical protein